MFDFTRPELAAVADRVAAGDDEGVVEEIRDFYVARSTIELPSIGGSVGESTADDILNGIFRYRGEVRDFCNEDEQRVDIDWYDTWGGTEEVPGGGQVLMTDFSFMPMLRHAYQRESDPQNRAAYAEAWMEISLDFFEEVQQWPTNRNLSAAKRMAQLVAGFDAFHTDPSIEASDLFAYIQGVHATTERLVEALPVHAGNNWYLSIARAIYMSAVYFPEFARSHVWEPLAVRSLEWFLGYMKSDGVYHEPTFVYQAYVADLYNVVIDLAALNGRALPPSLVQASDWIADSLFATRMPNHEQAMVGDGGNPDAGIRAIRTSGERNSWSDLTWLASDRSEGSVPALGSTIYPVSFAVQRSGWDADARYMLINNQESSYIYSHRHPDDLSLVMAAYGRPLIVDPASRDYRSNPVNDWLRRTTEAHNTIEVDGEPQEAGITRASQLWRSNEGLDVYRGEAHGYRPVIHDRVVYFVKPGFWVVSDALTGDTETHDYRQLWHFPGDPVSADPETNIATVGFDTVPGTEPVAGVRLVPVSPADVEVAPIVHQDGVVRVGTEVLTDLDFLSYDWTIGGSTGLDTVVVPGEAGPAPSVRANRIEMPGVEHAVATALEIDLEKATGRFYLSREETPSVRSFGEAATNGETAYLERDNDGALTRYALTAGSTLSDDGETVVDASGMVSDLSVRLEGDTAAVSLSDPFTGTLQIAVGAAEQVLINGEPAEFTRTGDLVTVAVEEDFEPQVVLEESFNSADLDSVAYGVDDGVTFDSWMPVQGTWEFGGESGTSLAQTSSADLEAFAVEQDVPDAAIITADVKPGDREGTTARTGLAARYHDSRNHYRAHVLSTSDGATLQIVKVDDGESEVLAEAELDINADDPHTLTLSAVGSHLAATLGETTISATDQRLPTGGAAAYTDGRAATFETITITEALDQDHWQVIAGEAIVGDEQLRLRDTDTNRAHVLAASTLPARFSDQCNYVVEATVTLHDVGEVGISLRDSSDAYGYRFHVGRTSGDTQYASIRREAHQAGPVTLAEGDPGVPLIDEPVDLRATIHGDRLTLSVNGEQIAEARDTLVRAGGVGLYTTSDSTFKNVSVSSGEPGTSHLEIHTGPGSQSTATPTDTPTPRHTAGAG
ncbi:alginate lyase family protein [Ruania alba]|uniref:Heparinase II/III N-terminus n=1 Tax=Ruania alba TaxID=648782 RepID=A0A1H5BL53_9MICO|nr:alginate lyase family protein [Ruania alba]SED55353.1 Heparinase II/III N-terminus [Ruania alba]